MRWTDAPTSAAASLERWKSAHGARLVERLPQEDVAVLLEPHALRIAWQHVAVSRLERGGLLLGTPLASEAGALAAVHVRAAVPALDERASPVALEMPPAVWDAARAQLAAGEVVVGWFHSHPGIGAFFSGTDRRTQAGFFNHAFSLGWVIDPQRREAAWFLGPASEEIAASAVLTLAPRP